MNELINSIKSVVDDWSTTDDILSYTEKDIKKYFENLSGNTWGYTAIPELLSQILSLLKYEQIKNKKCID